VIQSLREERREKTNARSTHHRKVHHIPVTLSVLSVSNRNPSAPILFPPAILPSARLGMSMPIIESITGIVLRMLRPGRGRIPAQMARNQAGRCHRRRSDGRASWADIRTITSPAEQGSGRFPLTQPAATPASRGSDLSAGDRHQKNDKKVH
jgi:hypothetical protein